MKRKVPETDGLVAYLVTSQTDSDDFWLEIGRTYMRSDGSCSVRLNRLGLDAKLVLSRPKADKKK